MVTAAFKFDSSISSAVIDGYRALTRTGSGASGNGIFSIGKDTAWNSFNDETGVFTTSGLTIGTLSGLLKATTGVVSAASSGTDYEPPVAKTNLTETSSGILTITNGTGAVIGNSAVTIAVDKASAAQDGYLGKDDWAIFNGKQDVLTKYDLSETASSILSITGGLDSVLTNDVTIAVQKASAAQDGYLGKNDWTTFNGKLTSPMSIDGDIIIRSSGVAARLGIGNAGEVLTVSGGLPAWMAPSVGTQILQGDTRAYVHDTGSDGYFAVVTEGTEKMRVTPAGYVGIGTVDPTSSLDVIGSVEVSSNQWYYVGDPTTDSSWRIGLDTGEFVIQKRVSAAWVTKGTFA